MISFLLGKPSSGPRMTTTLAANSRLSRGYSAPARRGSIAACMAALFPFGLIFAAHERASVCSMTPWRSRSMKIMHQRF